MTKPRNYKTEAIIIKKTKLGEADRILTFYTPYLGKIQAVAKGVRRPRSKLSGHLELLTYSLVSLARGKNLDTVTGVQSINSFLTLKTDLELSSYALYVIELVNMFTEYNIENNPLFSLLIDILKQLETSTNHELVLRYFELHLLNYIGYRPQLQYCVLCQSSRKYEVFSFSPKAGGILCPDCSSSQSITYNISYDNLNLLRLLQETDYNIFNPIEVPIKSNSHIEMIMRNYIRYYLERELKSVIWLDNIKQQNNKYRIVTL